MSIRTIATATVAASLLMLAGPTTAQDTPTSGHRYRVHAGAETEPAKALATELPMMPTGMPGAARSVAAEAECSALEPGLVLVTVSWRMPEDYSGDQRLDVSPYWDGFAREHFQSFYSRPSLSRLDRMDSVPNTPIAVAVKDGEVTWEDPADRLGMQLEIDLGGFTDHFRVLTLSDDGWMPTEAFELELPVCPIDIKDRRR